MGFLRWLSFNLWYFRRPPWDTGISPPELLDFIRRNPPGRALDLGCGTGTNLLTLAQSGWQVTGVDFALPAIRRARRRFEQAGLNASLITCDVTALHNLSQPYDLILDIGCFHSLDQGARQQYLNHAQRLLAPGGSWLVYGFVATGAAAVNTPVITENEIIQISVYLPLVERRDSLDARGRDSTWLRFQMPPSI